MSKPSAAGASPIQNILLVERFHQTSKGRRFEATSLPGHLIHLVLEGHVRQECNGRFYELRPGSVIWYHEDELVRGVILSAPWTFYSVNFIAPQLPPPGFEARFFPCKKNLIRWFAMLHRAWHFHPGPPAVREWQVHSALLQILADLMTPACQPPPMDPRARLWWKLETLLRKDLSRHATLSAMADLVKRSSATIARSCAYAVGMPPLKRLKQVRMSLARGLVSRSDMSIGEIARQVGYARIHEFSRDYRKHFGKPPSSHRE
ncbi:MAG: AraC family transcriptional regulator [Verrucomicrobiae bacterium]|nr:AraC family transcriptional regulator [Verrucomicrobiae bacterium]